MCVPEVIKGCGINLFSEHISYGGIGDNIGVEQSQTQSQQPAGQRNVHITIHICKKNIINHDVQMLKPFNESTNINDENSKT